MTDRRRPATPAPDPTRQSVQEARRERLSKALRDNLRKRKHQLRERERRGARDAEAAPSRRPAGEGEG